MEEKKEEIWEHKVLVEVLVLTENKNPLEAKQKVLEQISPHFADCVYMGIETEKQAYVH